MGVQTKAVNPYTEYSMDLKQRHAIVTKQTTRGRLLQFSPTEGEDIAS